LLWSSVAYSQSKKEQILTLSNRVDSLTSVLLSDRATYSTTQKKLETVISNLSKDLDSVIYNFKILSIKNENLVQLNTQKQDTIDVVMDSIIKLNNLLYRKKKTEDVFPDNPWLGQKIIFQAKVNQVNVGDFSEVYFELFDINKSSDGVIIHMDDYTWKLTGYYGKMNNIEKLKEGELYQLTFQSLEYDNAPIKGIDWMLVEMIKVE
jgi:hypothetical protein